MTSEIRVNKLQNRVGLGTVEYTNTGIVVSGIVTANSFSGPLNTTSIDLNGDLDVDGHTNLDNVSVAGVTTFAGDITIADKIVHTGDTDTAIRFPGNDILTVELAGTEHLRVDTTATRITDKLAHTGDPDTMIRFPADNTFSVETAGSERLRITSTGQISISGAGTTFGVAKLNIAPVNRTTAFSASDGDTWHDLVLKQSASATTNSVGIAFEVSPSAYHKNAGTGIVAIKDGNNFDYGTHLAFITRPHTAVAEERLRITSDGKMGLGSGITSPIGNFEIYNSSGISSCVVRGPKALVAIMGDSDNSGASETDASLMFTSDSHTILNSPLSAHGFEIALINEEPGSGLRFHDGTANAERLRITSDGKFGFGGETSPEYIATFYDAGYVGVALKTNRSTATDNIGGLHFTTQSTNVAYIQSLVDGTVRIRNTSSLTERLRIDANGDINLGNNPTNQYGYKLNIQDSAVIYAQTASSGGLEAKWHLDNSAQLMTFGTVSTDDLALVTLNTERLRISSGGGHKITCNTPYYAANLTECNTNLLALNINQTRSGQTKGIAFGAIGNGTARTGIQCYDTSNNSANTLLLNPLGGKVAINITGEPSAQFEVANDSTTGQLHVKHGWASRRFFSLPIINNETRWYKIVNYAAGNMLIGSLQIYTTRQGGFNQTKGYNEWKVSYVGYNNLIYGTGAENSSFYAGTGAAVDIHLGGSPKNVYIKVPGSIYGGYVYFIFEGIINNWQLDGSYVTSEP